MKSLRLTYTRTGLERLTRWIQHNARKTAVVLVIMVLMQLLELPMMIHYMKEDRHRAAPANQDFPSLEERGLHAADTSPAPEKFSSTHLIHLNVRTEQPSTPPLKPHPLPLRSKAVTLTIQRGDYLGKILKKYHAQNALTAIMRDRKAAKTLTHLVIGHTLRLTWGKDGALHTLIYYVSPTKRLAVELDGKRNASGSKRRVNSRWITEPIQHRLVVKQVTVRHSLYGSAQQQGVPARLVAQLIHIFEGDINFAHQTYPNDQFTLLYPIDDRHGKIVHEGPILAAEVVNHSRHYTAIRFVDPTGDTHYYALNGHRLEHTFLRTPVKYTRISSLFSKRRRHPVLHRIRAHHGVDFAAPYGTPIHATADGRVRFKGWKHGYGRVVFIRHGTRYTTVYGHMQRFARHLRAKKWVKQGQIIGYVGSSGLATGPHVHYEFRIHNVPKNPLTVKVSHTKKVARRYWKAFQTQAKQWVNQLHHVNGMVAHR